MQTAAVITISDSRSAGATCDESGPAAGSLLRDMGFHVVESRIVPDNAAPRNITIDTFALCPEVSAIGVPARPGFRAP